MCTQSGFFFSSICRYLNDVNYFGGLDQEDLNQLFLAMQSNFKAWVSGFAPLAVGADIDSMAVQEFSRTLFNIRPDIAFSVARTIFQSDLRNILHQVVFIIYKCYLRSPSGAISWFICSYTSHHASSLFTECCILLKIHKIAPIKVTNHAMCSVTCRLKFLAIFSKVPRIWQFQ